jgi:hypothetical protein
MDPVELVERFNAAINGRELVGLCSLMSENHTFVDTEGAAPSGGNRRVPRRGADSSRPSRTTALCFPT